ncbi:MAG: porin [Kordiimonadaceae bacterium]|nr:porin [Kordiimonadaceae bacterium]
MLYLKEMRIAALIIALIAMSIGVKQANAEGVDVDFGGFVKVNAALATNGVNGIDDASGSYNADLLFASDNKGSRFGINAKETRLYVSINKNDTPFGPIKTYVEGNFGVESNADGNRVEAYGTSNTRFVLRHAYVEVGNFLIGQTISTFIDPKSFLDILDYGGNSAVTFARQPMVRFTVSAGEFSLRLALENPTSNLGDYDITDDQRMPDYVGRIDFDPSWGHLSVAGILRELRIDNGQFEAHKMTGGVIITAHKEIIPGRFEIVGQYLRGGIGHYGAFSAFADGIVLDDGQGGKYIDPVDIQGATFSTTMHFTEKLRSTVAVSWAESLDPGHNQQTLGTGHAIENVKSLHANIFYDLIKNFMIGFEYKKLIGELTDQTKPNVDRYQLSVLYTF